MNNLTDANQGNYYTSLKLSTTRSISFSRRPTHLHEKFSSSPSYSPSSPSYSPSNLCKTTDSCPSHHSRPFCRWFSFVSRFLHSCSIVQSVSFFVLAFSHSFLVRSGQTPPTSSSSSLSCLVLFVILIHLRSHIADVFEHLNLLHNKSSFISLFSLPCF